MEPVWKRRLTGPYRAVRRFHSTWGRSGAGLVHVVRGGARSPLGESAGFTVGSVDESAGTVRVFQQLDRDGRLHAPKTASSVCTLATPPWLVLELAALGRCRLGRTRSSWSATKGRL